MSAQGHDTGSSASGSRCDQHQLGSPGRHRVLLHSDPGHPQGDGQGFGHCRQVGRRAPGREHDVEHRSRGRGALGQDGRCGSRVETDGREHPAVVTFEPLGAIEADHPGAGGPVGDDERREDPNGNQAEIPAKERDQDDPRHRDGEGQSGLQATPPGRPCEPAQGVGSFVGGGPHRWASARSSR